MDSPIAAIYIWASRLFHTLPDLPLDWSYHRDLENFDEVAILPVKNILVLGIFNIYNFENIFIMIGFSLK